MSYNTVILGNGFDLDLGLKTRYRDFITSPQFLELMDSNLSVCKEFNLYRFIKGQSELETWGGVEASLLDFVQSINTQLNNESRNTIRLQYEDLEVAIAEYLLNISYEDIRRDSCAYYLLHKLHRIVNVYSFNYTNINKICNTNYDFVNRIHGTVEEKNAILGVQDENIMNGLGFVKKSYHSNYNSRDFVKDMLASEHILFFGHSMCMSDKEYFRTLFVNSQNNKCKHITFIVYDKNDMDMIAYNIEQISNTNLSVIRENIKIEFKFTSATFMEETKKVIDDFFEPKEWYLLPSGKFM